MHQNLDSIVLITSNDKNNNAFGTGFVIKNQNNACFIITCAHVVQDVGGAEHILVDTEPATIISKSIPEIDLAVLYVENLQFPELSQCGLGSKNADVQILGHSTFETKNHVARSLEARLGENIALRYPNSQNRIKAWDLIIEDGFASLRKGYSGSPVIDRNTNHIIAVATHHQLSGQKGHAISIDHLRDIWDSMPASVNWISTDSPNAIKANYDYDIFVSYNDDFSGEWVRKYFLTELMWFLQDKLERRPSVFIARQKQNNTNTLRYDWKVALALSRCFLPIWSPSYFDYRWSRYESTAMLQRQNSTNSGIASPYSRVIYPVVVSNGNSFHSFTREIPHLNCRPYMIPVEAFTKTLKYIKFRECIEEWANEVAHGINHAPDWNSNWLLKNVDIEDHTEDRTTNFSLPSMA